MGEKLRYGVIGAGAIADKKHLAAYASFDDVELAAICDKDTKRAVFLAQKYNIPGVFEDFREMFDNTKLDFISICTPNYLHEPIAVSALQKGINVHCEKPVALNAGEAQRIVEAKNKSGKKLMLGLNNRFTNASFYARKYIDKGNLGEIYHVKCGWRRRRGIPGRGSWFTNKALSGGGALIDLGVHLIDLSLYLIGNWNPESVTASTYSRFSDNLCRNSWSYGTVQEGVFSVEDMAVGFVRLYGGITLEFEFSWASNIEKDHKYYEILGTKGGILFSEDKLKIFSEMYDTTVDIYPNTNYSQEAVNEFCHFIDCINKEMEPLATPEQAYEVMRIIDAAYLSSCTGKEVVLQ